MNTTRKNDHSIFETKALRKKFKKDFFKKDTVIIFYQNSLTLRLPSIKNSKKNTEIYKTKNSKLEIEKQK
jgi:hypothetical protein